MYTKCPGALHNLSQAAGQDTHTAQYATMTLLYQMLSLCCLLQRRALFSRLCTHTPQSQAPRWERWPCFAQATPFFAPRPQAEDQATSHLTAAMSQRQQWTVQVLQLESMHMHVLTNVISNTVAVSESCIAC